MRHLIYRFAEYLVKGFCFIIGLLPRKYVRYLGRPLGVLWFDILRLRRRVVLDNLNRAFPNMDSNQKVKIGRQSVYQVTENFMEFFLIPSMNTKWLDLNTLIEGKTNLENALSRGKGVIALSMHLGHGDMGVSTLAAYGFKVHLITKLFKNKFFNHIWFYIRQAQGVKFIEPHGQKTPFEILKALKSNEVVIFVNDQFMGKPFGIETTFFGQKTGTAFGLALFYLKTKSPVVPIYTYNGKDGKVHVRIEPELQLESYVVSEKEASYHGIIQHVNDVIQSIVAKYPEQWMWLHRRWKKFE